MGLGGRGLPGFDDTAPIVRFSRKPPKVWGTLDVEDDSVVVRLEGWRSIWAAKRTLRVPLKAVIAAAHDPGAYVNVKTRLRSTRRPRSTTFKLGAQHGFDGWSFWACGLARNAVVLETVGVRYRFVVVEVADPQAVVAAVRKAAGIEAPKPPAPPTVRPITDSKRLLRDPKSPSRKGRAGTDVTRQAKISSIGRPPPRDEVAGAPHPAEARPHVHRLAAEPKRRADSAPGADTTKEHDQT
jgi:hypothetical protein